MPSPAYYKQQIHFFRMLPLAFLLLYFSPLASAGEATAPLAVASYSYKVVKSYPHDPDSFTQGLVLDKGLLFEGTGRYGLSSLRQVDLHTGKTIKAQKLPRQYFGEGVTVFGDRIIQLTWRSKTIFIYDKSSFERIKSVQYPFEGWGITTDGSHLITSDGTSIIRFLDPISFEEKKRIEVIDRNGPVRNLNELEYVNGVIYANVWHSDRIALIDPENGRVTGWLDLSGLLDTKGEGQSVDVLNGIAYDPENGSLYVTGKLWPWLFEIQPVLMQE